MIDRRATRVERHRLGRAAVVLQRTKFRIDVVRRGAAEHLTGSSGHIQSGRIADQIMAERVDLAVLILAGKIGACAVRNVFSDDAALNINVSVARVRKVNAATGTASVAVGSSDAVARDGGIENVVDPERVDPATLGGASAGDTVIGNSGVEEPTIIILSPTSAVAGAAGAGDDLVARNLAFGHEGVFLIINAAAPVDVVRASGDGIATDDAAVHVGVVLGKESPAIILRPVASRDRVVGDLAGRVSRSIFVHHTPTFVVIVSAGLDVIAIEGATLEVLTLVVVKGSAVVVAEVIGSGISRGDVVPAKMAAEKAGVILYVERSRVT